MGVGAGLYMYDVVVKKFPFAISSPDEFLYTGRMLFLAPNQQCQSTISLVKAMNKQKIKNYNVGLSPT